MSFREQLQAVATALLLPFVAVGTLVYFTMATVDFGASDRAVVWVQGEPSQLATAESQLMENPWFGHARVRAAGPTIALPDACGPEAREYSLGGLRMEEAQAARAVIEGIATDSGASICNTNVFIINELPDAPFELEAHSLSRNLLQSALIPGGIALALFLALAPALGLRLSTAHTGLPAQMAWGIVAALVWLLLSSPLEMLLRAIGLSVDGAPQLTFSGLGASWSLAIVLVEPFVRELAFRAWMIPLAERTLGTLPAALASAAAYAALSLPATPGDGLMAFGLGTLLAGLYVRTRSLLACTLAASLVSLAAFLPP